MKIKASIAYTLLIGILSLCLWNASWATCTHDIVEGKKALFSLNYCTGQCADINTIDHAKDHIQENVLARPRTTTRIKLKSVGQTIVPYSLSETFSRQVAIQQFGGTGVSILTLPYYYQFLFRFVPF